MRKLSLLAICLLLGSMYIAYAQQLTEPAPHRMGVRTAERSRPAVGAGWLKRSFAASTAKPGRPDSCCPPAAQSLPVAAGCRVTLTAGGQSESGSVEFATGTEPASGKTVCDTAEPGGCELAHQRSYCNESTSECGPQTVASEIDACREEESESCANAFTILEQFGSIAEPERECSAEPYHGLIDNLRREGWVRVSDATPPAPGIADHRPSAVGPRSPVVVVPPGMSVPGCLPGTVPGYVGGPSGSPHPPAIPYSWDPATPPLVCSLPGYARVDRDDNPYPPTHPHRSAGAERIHHLLEAAEHLDAAGNQPLAQQIRGQVRQMQREQRRQLLALKQRQLARLEEEIRDLQQGLQREFPEDSGRELVLDIRFLEVSGATLRELELVPRTGNDVALTRSGRAIIRAGVKQMSREQSAPQLAVLDAGAGVLDELDRLLRAGAIKQLAAPRLWTRSGQRARFSCGVPLTGQAGHASALGVKLEVLPRLAADGGLLLEAVPEVTRAVAPGDSPVEDGRLPNLQQYRVHTRAQMEPGQTLLITLNDAPGRDGSGATSDSRVLVQIRVEMDADGEESSPVVERLQTAVNPKSECEQCGQHSFFGFGAAVRTAEAYRKSKNGPELICPDPAICSNPSVGPHLSAPGDVDILPPPMLLNLPSLPDLEPLDDREPAPPALPE